MSHFLIGFLIFVSAASASTYGTLKIGVFETGKVLVEIGGEAAKEIANTARSPKNLACENEVCRFEFDSNFKARKTKLALENASKRDQYNINVEGDGRELKLSSYSANGDPNRGTLVKALYQLLVEESKRSGTKVKGEAITNHDYAYAGTNLLCTSFVSGDYLCEMRVNRSGLTRN